MKVNHLKTTQFKNYISKINKLSLISSSIFLVMFIGVYFGNSELVIAHPYEFACSLVLLLIIIHLKASNLKQKAIIRYITNSTNDNGS